MHVGDLPADGHRLLRAVLSACSKPPFASPPPQPSPWPAVLPPLLAPSVVELSRPHPAIMELS